MSQEQRLKNLGVWHLRDNPEELQKELQRQMQETRKTQAERKAKRLSAQQPRSTPE